tara:strand:+ start:348773 stop:350026 length:1254 start_codon:yes stop_codon:yes gene_type:complete
VVRVFIYSLIALAIGAWLSVMLMEDPGYVLITFRNYSVEASLATIVLSLLVIYVLLYGLLKLLILFNPLKLFHKETWYALFFRKNVRLQSEKGLQLLLLGHWQDAYKKLVESAERAQTPVFNYLAAAYAAFQRHDHLACTYCLSQAKKHTIVPNSGIKTFQALLEHQSGKDEQSLALLLAIQQEQPDSPFVLRLLKDIYFKLKDWQKLAELQTELEKYRVLNNEELLLLKEHLAVHRFHEVSSKQANEDELKSLWNSLNKVIQKRELVTEAYLRALLSIGKNEEAQRLLIKFVKRQWSERLIVLLGYIDSEDAASNLLLLEGWIKDRPKDVYLMLTLGRLGLRSQLWGKAREYFETALRFSDSTKLSAEINAELGRLLEHLGEHERSLMCYRQAMDLMDHKIPDLPQPEKPADREAS